MGVGGLTSNLCPEQWLTAQPVNRRIQRFERWPFGWPQTVSSTETRFRPSSRKSSPLHEPLAIGQGEEAVGLIAPNRMSVAWQSGSHRRLKRPGWPNYTFAFHDDDEVGPGLLRQIGKKTGLRPEDL